MGKLENSVCAQISSMPKITAIIAIGWLWNVNCPGVVVTTPR